MEGKRQEGKLVTYICPTCGKALKFENGKKTTTCPSCKNEVEKQFVVNLNFATTADDENFKNCYSYDKSLFKFNFNVNDTLNMEIRKRDFTDDISFQKLSPNQVIELDKLIQELLFKMDNADKIKDKENLMLYADKILAIDENNVYGLFLKNYLTGEDLTDVLSRRDSLDKGEFFCGYLTTENDILFRYYTKCIPQIITYILNCNLKTMEEKYNVIFEILSEHIKEKPYFESFAEEIFTVISCDGIPNKLKQNLVKKIMDIAKLNDYPSFVKYVQANLNVDLSVDKLFKKDKIKEYLGKLEPIVISRVIDFIWLQEKLELSKKLDYTDVVIKEIFFTQSINLSAEDCASLINVLKDKPIKYAKISKYLKHIVSLSLIEKIDIDSIEKEENKKIKKQLNYGKNKNNKNIQSIKEKRLNNKKKAAILSAEYKNKKLKKTEEFENARLIAYLIDVNINEKLKVELIDIIKIPYQYEPCDEVLNLIDLVNQSNYNNKNQLIKYLILNCVNISSYKDALTTLEFIKRLNISPQEKENYSRYFLYNKSKESLKNMTGYLYLLSYLKDENERFKFLFSVICTYNKNMFYEMNNADVAYASGDLSDDLYLLICKCSIKFAYNSVSKEHFDELVNEINTKINTACIGDFTESIQKDADNASIIKWVTKKPLSQKDLEKDSFMLSHRIK